LYKIGEHMSREKRELHINVHINSYLRYIRYTMSFYVLLYKSYGATLI